MISGHTRVLAIVGHPVRHSLSPALHNAWLRAAGIDAVYVALDSTVDPAMLVRGGLWGANITIPLKTRCSPDRLAADAAATGAVNTLYWDGDVLVGDNTDVHGFRTSTESALGPIAGRNCVVLGGGGAARAVVHALKQAGADHIQIMNRSQVNLGVPCAHFDAATLENADLVVNTLPAAARSIVEALALPSTGAWVDLNYWDADPPKREDVAKTGLSWLGGHAMLEAQAARSFALWTGQTPPTR